MPAEMDIIAAGVLRDAIRKNLTMLDAIERAGLPGQGSSLVKRAGLRAAARTAQREMKKRVGVRTGRTRDRIKVESRVEQGGRNIGLVRVPPPWNILEFGRSPGPGYGGAPPYPFITVSIRATEAQQLIAAGEAMRKSLEQRIVRAAGGGA